MTIPDPVEAIIAKALDNAGISYTRDNNAGTQLDFYLTDYDVHIECKRFHSPRILEQTSRFNNVIVIQGLEAAKLFAELLQQSG